MLEKVRSYLGYQLLVRKADMYIPTNSDMHPATMTFGSYRRVRVRPRDDDPDERSRYLTRPKRTLRSRSSPTMRASRESTMPSRDLIDECSKYPRRWIRAVAISPHTIDYEAAADEARHDYYEVDFDGVTYLCR